MNDQHLDRLLDELISAEQAGHSLPSIPALPNDSEFARKLVQETQGIHMNAQFALQLENQLKSAAIIPASRPKIRPNRWVLLAAVLVLILIGGVILNSRDSSSGVYTTQITDAPLNNPPLQERPTERMWQIALSPDGQILAQGGCNQPAGNSCLDGQVRFWDVTTEQPLPDYTQTLGTVVTDLVYSPNGQWLAISGCGATDDNGYCIDGEIWLMNTTTYGVNLLKSIPAETTIARLQFTSDGTHIIGISVQHGLVIWDLEVDQLTVQPFDRYPHTDLANAIISADGRIMAYQTDDFSFGFWDIEAGEIVGMPITGPDAVSSALAMNPDDYGLVSTTPEGHIVKWDWSPLGELVHEDLAWHGGTILDLEFGSYGLPLISAHDNGALLAWIMTAEGQSVPQTLDMGDSPVLEIAFNADHDLFAVIRMDNTISVWDATNAGAIHKIHEFGGE